MQFVVAMALDQTLGMLLPLGHGSETGSHYVDKAGFKLTEMHLSLHKKIFAGYKRLNTQSSTCGTQTV